MTRINTNVSSLIAQNRLNKVNGDLQTSLTRLSTGLRINSGKDDPAGLIASNALRSDITSLNKAISNTARAGQIVATADSALGQVNSLLNNIRGLVVEAANKGALSDSEIAANQLQIDSSLEAINRIANTTSFQGRKLLDGSLDYLTTAGSGYNTIRDLKINQANLSNGALAVNVTISAAAQKAQVDVTNISSAGISHDAVFELVGKSGSEVFNVKAGTTLGELVTQINLVSDSTGVKAAAAGTTLELTSSEFGSDAFVDLRVISENSSGTFTSAVGAGSRDAGTDIVAKVNGVDASGKGNSLSINTSALALSMTVNDGSSTSVSFNITGGGAVFQLGGELVSNQQARLGIASVNTARLGGVSGKLFDLSSGGSASLTKNPSAASKIVSEAINQISSLRGRLGAFQATTLDSNTSTLSDTVNNLTEAESSIRDADFAAESAKLTRAQILTQSATSVLGIANQAPQNVLSLLR